MACMGIAVAFVLRLQIIRKDIFTKKAIAKEDSFI
jgi:hypothetical protein